MSSFTQISIAPDATLDQVIAKASQTLSAQGLEVRAQMMGPNTATLNVGKDRDGFKNFLGMGIECNTTLTLVGPGQVNVNTESVWTNKIIALVVGWFLCLIPFITGIVGVFGQSDLPKKINSALTMAAASGSGFGGGYGAPYGAPQAPYAAPQAPQAPYAAPQAPQAPQAPYDNNQQPPTV